MGAVSFVAVESGRQDAPGTRQRRHIFLIAPNNPLPFPDNSVDRVYTNSVPIDTTTWLGVGVQSSEIRRILKPGGEWIRDGVSVFTKP